MGTKRAKDIYNGAEKQGAKGAKVHKEPIIQFKNQLIANAAFQIRTLSNAIIGFSDLLRYEQLTDSQTEYVNEIYNAGKDVVALVDDVLELFRIESGQLSIDIVNCSFGGLLDKIDSLVRHCAEEKGLEFEILQCTDLPANIRTDSSKLCQCLINLVSNAIKFTEVGYVQLRVSIEDCDGQPYIRFDVADSGPGIPFDKQESIFEPFAQEGDVDEGVSTSSGLGLTITHHLVRLLGGEVSVISMQGEGSVFSLLIPAGVDVASQPLLEQREPLVSLSEEEVDHRQCVGNVLLVENEPSNRTVMTLLLEAMGLHVSTAEDGLQAVEKAVAEPFDLILMDIKMPRMDGHEARQSLREKGLATPIIALSASSPSDDDPDSSKLADFNCFLVKPVDSRKLYEAISKYLPVVRSLDSTGGKSGTSSAVSGDSSSSEGDDEPEIN